MQFCETLNASERDYGAYSFVHEFRDVQSIPPKLFIVHRSLQSFSKRCRTNPRIFSTVDKTCGKKLFTERNSKSKRMPSMPIR